MSKSKYEPAFCPKCDGADCFEVVNKGKGRIVVICKLCGWDSEADDAFEELAKDELNLF